MPLENPVPTIIKVKLMPGGIMPKKGKPGDAGFDCCANIPDGKTMLIAPGCGSPIKLGIALEMPEDFECQIRPRSGLSSKGVIGTFGTVDSGYRGELVALLVNHSDNNCLIEHGSRIAQIIFQRLPTIELVQALELSASERGNNGFGSTGLR